MAKPKYGQISHRDVNALNKQRLGRNIKTAAKVGASAVGVTLSPVGAAVGFTGAKVYKQLKKSWANPSPTRKILYPATGVRGTVHGESAPNPKFYRKINKLDTI